jgi:hypothetical protein
MDRLKSFVVLGQARSSSPLLDRISRVAHGIHLAYLGVLPALATFGVLRLSSPRISLLTLLGGIVAVSVYLAVVISYTRQPASRALGLLALLDGPIWVALAQRGWEQPVSAAIDGFLVDGLAIWLAIGWLAVTTSRPTQGQRIATLGLVALAGSAVLAIFWPHIRDNFARPGARWVWLVLGLGQAVVMRHYVLDADEVVVGEKASGAYIGLLLVVWLVALILGASS